MIQGGDFTKRNGTGGESIWGGVFPDEDLTRPLDSEGLLCMANRGPDTNGSQFFITLRDCPHLSGKHVVFGKLIRGYDDVVKKVADVPVDDKDRPLVPVVISNCGELELRKSAVQSRKRVKSVSDDEAERGEQDRSRSSSPTSASRRERRNQRKLDKKKRLSATQNEEPAPQPSVPHQETEEEYDARLEREEAERLAAERKKEMERIRKEQESASEHLVGVRFKGRGRMQFRDPELYERR